MSQSIACIGIDCVMDSRKKLRIAEFRVFREGLHRGKHYRRGGPADIQFRRPSSCMCTGERLPMYVPSKLNALFAAIACAYRLEILSFSHTEQAVSIQSAAQLLRNCDRMLWTHWQSGHRECRAGRLKAEYRQRYAGTLMQAFPKRKLA